ncbi:MAG: LytR/AlgR family response regulator transcription factor [Granulosicoccus sp.]
MNTAYTAVIADDEPLLAHALTKELENSWPQLTICSVANDGNKALAAIKEYRPDIAFLDIRMPGATGIEVAETIAEDWPDERNNDETDIENSNEMYKSPPLIVFVTAYDNYAVQAFESAAIDYLLKPVRPERLKQTIERLKQHLHQPERSNADNLGDQIREIIASQMIQTATDGRTEELRMIRASVGDAVRMIPVDDVIFFESADKYVSVHTETYEAVIREPLRNLLPRLDQKQFAQIHRRTIVNLNKVVAAVRDETGKVTLQLKNHKATPVVSRIHRHMFQAM